ncbi:macrosialin-like isoform X2 [Osmerus mordax]|uniref:macrosialin-like isoform X2 n=1 Tax=Osmerus mordax TaxID=8014 RepID=UPI00350F2FEB
MKGFLLLCTLAFVSGLLPEGSTALNPPGSIFPPSEFDLNTTTTTKTPPTTHNTTTPPPTTHNTTTPPPTTHNTTTASTTRPTTTTPPPTTHNTTTASTTPPTTTTPPPTTHNTTTPPPTTHNTTTASTTRPTTTTPPPTTHNTTTASTTPPTTTTPPPTTHNTTTPPPTTHNTTTASTTPPPTAKPKPTKHANLTVGTYTLPGEKGLCLRAQMALEFQLVTDKANGTFIVQPSMTKASGKCETSTAKLTLNFIEGFITLSFNKSAADKMVYVDAISFELSYPFTSGGNQKFSQQNNSLHLFAAATGYSYSCKSDSLYMGNGLYLDVTQDQMQAFNLVNNQDFGKPQPCPADKPDYRVAIAVGVVLLVLIVIVLIAYLLGRRKRTSGYQSL